MASLVWCLSSALWCVCRSSLCVVHGVVIGGGSRCSVVVATVDVVVHVWQSHL